MKHRAVRASNIYQYLFLLGNRIGCHQRSDRSFFWHGYQFPICARCTGVLISYLVSIPLYFLFDGSYVVSLTTMGIMFLDWAFQFVGLLESTNFRRFITGICGGYGVMTFQILSVKWLVLICTNFL